MKKSFNFIKRIVIVFLVVVNLFCFCGCSWLFEYGWNWRGPYHHAAVITIPRKTVSVGEETYSLIDKKLYKHNNGQLEALPVSHDGIGNCKLYDIASDNEKLYLTCYGDILSLDKNGLNLIHSESMIFSLAVDDGKIYYINFLEWIGEKYKNELCSYDLEKRTKEKLCEFLSAEKNYLANRQLIKVGERLLFMNERMNLFWVDELGEQNRISTSYSRFEGTSMLGEISFVLEEKIAKLKIVEEGICFEYLDETYEYPIQANALRLYPIVKVIENKIYFAVNDWVQKEDCEKPDCLCGYNKSMLITFDLESKQLSVKKEIGEMDAFIDFNKDESIYYSKGIIYRNESVLEQVEEIQPGVPYRIVPGTVSPHPIYDLKITYYQGEINWIIEDNRAYLEDEYA